jgi:hypothetical protein
MDNMNELTVLEIAEILKIPPKTVTSRIRLKKIKEVRKVGRTNIFNPDVVEQLRYADPVGPKKKIKDKQPKKPVGRPKKATEPAKPVSKGKKTK